MDRIIIHVDMDAFYASVEIRDNPDLKGKPVIIGALPDQRGVVATCSYEARRYGVLSGMNIKEAYSLCPDGVYMHPDFTKYREVSEQLHGIWDPYASASEPIALDETFLDVTETISVYDAVDHAKIKYDERKTSDKETYVVTDENGFEVCYSYTQTAGLMYIKQIVFRDMNVYGEIYPSSGVVHISDKEFKAITDNIDDKIIKAAA